MEEVATVARVVGIPLAEDVAEQRFRMMLGYDPSVYVSSYFDLIAGRRLEIEALTGALVRLGEVHGIPTPDNRAVYAILKPFADGAPALPRKG